MLATSYTLSAHDPAPFADAVERVRDELKAEGFGVLCEIDVQATLREKLGVEGEPYLILGACNPPLAHQALEAEPELGVLLPCNVVVYERDGETHISAIDAERMLSIVGNDELAPVAAEVQAAARRRRRASRQQRLAQQPSQLSPRQLSTPSRAATAPITSAAAGSAHHGRSPSLPDTPRTCPQNLSPDLGSGGRSVLPGRRQTTPGQSRPCSPPLRISGVATRRRDGRRPEPAAGDARGDVAD